jgi:hypothetical protein
MSRFYNPLDNVHVASPCSADWESMYGDDRTRFCAECKLNVYNLSGMTREEAERLVTNAEGRLCVRFYRRADGSIITADCPVGWARVKQRTRVYAGAAMSMLAALLSGLFFVSLFRERKVESTVGVMRIEASPSPTPMMGNFTTMGAVAPRREVAQGVMANTSSDEFNRARAKALAGGRD